MQNLSLISLIPAPLRTMGEIFTKYQRERTIREAMKIIQGHGSGIIKYEQFEFELSSSAAPIPPSNSNVSLE